MPVTTLGSVSIWYDVSGHGDPTAFVHGSLVDHTTWERVRRGLAPSLRVLVYDRRGYGESAGPPRKRPVRDDADDLARLLSSIDLFPVHVIAHSYGGAVALRLTADRPEMVRSLILHEPPFIGLLEEDPATAPEADRLMASLRAMVALVGAGHPEEAVREVVASLSPDEVSAEKMAPEIRARLTRYADRWAEEISDPEATRPSALELSDVLIPVLITTGERSPPFLHRIAGCLASALRNATLRTLPGAGHLPHLSDPDQFIATVHSFLVERSVPVT